MTKKLNELLDCEYDILIESIEDDSRVPRNNSLFFCIKGFSVDGHDFVDQAILNGAVAIVSEKKIKCSVPNIVVKNTMSEMVKVLSKFYDHPESKMKFVGVTGTDGKTSTTDIIYQLINQVEDNCGLIGTNGIISNYFNVKTQYTTPMAKQLFAALHAFAKIKTKYISMEVTSEALRQGGRVDDLSFDIAIFTNLTKEHMNNHKTMDDYKKCKAKLFKQVKKNGYSIINNDDTEAHYFKNVCKSKVITYGIYNKSDVYATDIVISENRLLFKLNSFYGTYSIDSPLSGKFNVYNILSSVTACHLLGFDTDKIVENIKHLKPISGRAESIDMNQDFKIIIDFAHTPNSLKNLLEYVRVITKKKIITVTGTAGGRDKEKRSDMGLVVTDLSEYVIFTMDDPRYEDPNDIIDDMVKDIKDKKKYERIVDRRAAIYKALSIANKDDTVVIAGRGNDSYIPINGKYIYCNDYEAVYSYFEEDNND